MDFQLLPEMLQDDRAAANLCFSQNGNMKNAAGLSNATANASQFCTFTQKCKCCIAYLNSCAAAKKGTIRRKLVIIIDLYGEERKITRMFPARR